MRSSREVEFVSPINYPLSSMVILMCHDNHQKMKGFLIGHGSWDFAPHLMRGATPHASWPRGMCGPVELMPQLCDSWVSR